MKKILLSLTFIVACFSFLQAQNLLSKVPANATLVIKYGSINFSQHVPLQKIDGYSFVKDNLYKLLGVSDTVTSVQNMGINVDQDAYQYVNIDDSCLNFVTVLPLKNSEQFVQLLKQSYKVKATDKMVSKQGYDFVSLSDNSYVGYNSTTAILVRSSYQNKRNYYESYNTTVVVDSITVKADTTFTQVEEYKVPPKKNPTVNEKGYKVPKKPNVKKPINGKKAPIKKTVPKKPAQKKPADEDVKVYNEETYVMPYEDSMEMMKRELWNQQQDLISKKQQQTAAEKIIETSFNGTIKNISSETNYTKIIEPNAHISVWADYENLFSQYQNLFSSAFKYGIFGGNSAPINNKVAGNLTGMNMYFDNNKIRVEQKSFNADPALANMGKDVMNSKQLTGLAALVNADNLAYASISVNNQAATNYYYTIMKKYLRSNSYMAEYADLVDVYVDLLEIVIDEKGLSDLSPGNYMFVLHNMATKMVDYTDYTYDSEYNKTEVKKTKKELAPNFTFAMETKKEAFMQKIANLPVKYASKFEFKYVDKGGFYELAFDSSKYPVSSLYFMVKDGKVIVTTSKDVIAISQGAAGFKVDDEINKSILNNNYSAQLNTKKLMSILEQEASTKTNKDICNYLQQNMGTVKTESSFKDGFVVGTSTLNIEGNHKNSLEFIFNIIDNVYKITETNRKETEKRVD